MEILKQLSREIDQIELLLRNIEFERDLYASIIKQILLMNGNRFHLEQPKVMVEKNRLDEIDINLSNGEINLIRKDTGKDLSSDDIKWLRKCLNMNQSFQENKS